MRNWTEKHIREIISQYAGGGGGGESVIAGGYFTIYGRDRGPNESFVNGVVFNNTMQYVSTDSGVFSSLSLVEGSSFSLVAGRDLNINMYVHPKSINGVPHNQYSLNGNVGFRALVYSARDHSGDHSVNAVMGGRHAGFLNAVNISTNTASIFNHVNARLADPTNPDSSPTNIPASQRYDMSPTWFTTSEGAAGSLNANTAMQSYRLGNGPSPYTTFDAGTPYLWGNLRRTMANHLIDHFNLDIGTGMQDQRHRISFVWAVPGVMNQSSGNHYFDVAGVARLEGWTGTDAFANGVGEQVFNHLHTYDLDPIPFNPPPTDAQREAHHGVTLFFTDHVAGETEMIDTRDDVDVAGTI